MASCSVDYNFYNLKICDSIFIFPVVCVCKSCKQGGTVQCFLLQWCVHVIPQSRQTTPVSCWNHGPCRGRQPGCVRSSLTFVILYQSRTEVGFFLICLIELLLNSSLAYTDISNTMDMSKWSPNHLLFKYFYIPSRYDSFLSPILGYLKVIAWSHGVQDIEVWLYLGIHFSCFTETSRQIQRPSWLAGTRPEILAQQPSTSGP